MNAERKAVSVTVVALLVVLVLTSIAPAQPRFGGQGPRVVSPEVAADRHVTFRILAPKAEAVLLSGSDIPDLGRGAEMTKDPNGVWEVTLGPIDPGAYRYNFNVDGVSVIDPRSSSTSESNNNVWSLVYVPGSDFMDTQDVPRGAKRDVFAVVPQQFEAEQRGARERDAVPPRVLVPETASDEHLLRHPRGSGLCAAQL